MTHSKAGQFFPMKTPLRWTSRIFYLVSYSTAQYGRWMVVGSEQVGPLTFCNSCSSFYLSQTYKPSLQKLDPRGRLIIVVLTSQPPKYGQIHPQRASSAGARSIYGWELWNEALQVNSNYSMEAVGQWNLVRAPTWCPRRHRSTPRASCLKCWCISPPSGSCVQSGITITELARGLRDSRAPTFSVSL